MSDKKLKIVIADDDADDQFFLIEAIKKNQQQHSLHSVFDGSQLLDLLHGRGKYKDAAQRPDLILLDLNMPVVDGFAALSQIKKNEALKDIKVFILSTSRRENDKTACKLLGADEFYSKPMQLESLKMIVQDILDKAQPRRASA
jgi:CheY-like chemotaxis protein